MTSQTESRVIQLELLVQRLRDRLDSAQAAIDALKQAQRQGTAGGGGSGGGSGFAAVVVDGVTPRVGGVLGSGTVQALSTSGGTITGIGGLIAVHTISQDVDDSGYNIAPGKYCWVQANSDGVNLVAPLEC